MNSSEVEGVFWGASASNGGSHTFQSKTFSLNPKSPFSVAADCAGAFFSELADNVQRQDVVTYWRSSVHHDSQAHGIRRKLNIELSENVVRLLSNCGFGVFLNMSSVFFSGYLQLSCRQHKS